ncbi:hypothetical protein ACFL2H_04355 [Planctomycetota bacterium]
MLTKKRSLRVESLEHRAMLAVVTDWGTFADNADAWPSGWENMEIEAKWSVTEATLESIAANTNFDSDADTFDFDGEGSLNYDVNVRNGGEPKKFTDLYYDNPDEDLDGAAHALRHRLREDSSTGGAASDDIDDLLNEAWARDWEKVQYKSTPARFDEVWFRTESGGGQLTGSGDVLNPTLNVVSTLNGTTSVQTDDPVVHANDDHSGLVWLDDTPTADRIAPFLLVTDFRYRVRFEDPNTGEERYELSLDKVRSCTPDVNDDFTVCTDFFEAELEVLIDVESVQVEDEVTELFAIADWFESNYTMTPSTTSKGGNEVNQFGDFDGDDELDIADIDLIWDRIVLSQNGGVSDEDYDLDRDGDVDADDGLFLVKDLMELFIGDANLDGLFNSADLVLVFGAAEYEDAIANNSTWAEGDWNFDGEFDSGDLVAAFADGGYTG